MVCLGGIGFGAISAHAQDAMSVSVTPPLVQLTIGPGESWASSLKVVNNNSYDVSYYVHVMDFTAQGEDGTGTFAPIVDQAKDPGAHSFSLGSWLHLSSAPLRVPKGTSAEIPFSVQVPANAEPGGHYAAILIGTNPDNEQLAGPSMKISSFVSSLIFVRIRGEANESGRIREFTAEKSLYESADAKFLLRFENTGNTHLRPQGDITLYNMWGKQRGRVLINQNGNFGNVLPSSTRRFEFAWSGESDLLDLGRYSAVVTLAYGEDAKHNVSATTYFWVVPTKPVAIALGIIVAFLVIITWFIRGYIRRALALEQQRLGVLPREQVARKDTTPSVAVLLEPLKEGAIDLRRLTQQESPLIMEVPLSPRAYETQRASESLTFLQFLKKYRSFFLFIIFIAIAAFGSVWYFSRVLVQSRTYQISDIKAQEEKITTAPAQSR